MFGDAYYSGPRRYATKVKNAQEAHEAIRPSDFADTPVSMERTLDRGSMREFDNRILFQMSANDSSNLIDSPAANKLGTFRALVYSEEQGVMEKFRPYAPPPVEWVEGLKLTSS